VPVRAAFLLSDNQMGTSATSLFTGSSQFASDLQGVITRAVNIATLPMTQTQQQVSTLQSQSSELSTISSDFVKLQSAIADIQSGAGQYSGTSSNSAVASVSVSGTPMPGTYSIDVSSLGTYATAMSADGLSTVTDAASGSITDATNYTLRIGSGAGIAISPQAKTLSALADAINATGQAQATIVNIGTTANPDYRLSLQGVQLADAPIELTAADGASAGEALLTPGATGSPTVYQVNGSPAFGVSTNTASVTISPGVTATLLGTGVTTVTVSADTSSLTNALSSFASLYNTAQAELTKNRGSGTGGLNGDSIVQQLSTALRNLVGFTSGNTGISSLTPLGFSLDKSGVLSFDPAAFATAVNGNTRQVSDFFDSSAGGFLQAATNILNGLEDPENGSITTALQSLQDQIAAGNRKISDQQDAIDTLQKNLTAQMAKAGHLPHQHVPGHADQCAAERPMIELDIALRRDAEALRRAVNRADFADAAACSERYARLLASLLPHLPAPQRADQWRSGCDLIEWARRNACAARARLAEDLRNLECAKRYRGAAVSLHTWKIDV
jgi:flagellar hook-associated protein 2